MSWKKVKLVDLCIIEKGKTGISKAIEGEFPLVVTAEERKTHNEYQFDDDAVIIPLVSGTGHGHASIKRLHFQSGKFALGSILCAVIPKDKSILNAEYLYRFLNLNKERELVDRMKGMANVSLPIKEIAKIEIPLPSLEEQIEFVEKYALLETDSEDISNELTHQLDLIKQLRQAFLREAMQGSLTPTLSKGEGAETGHDLLAKIKADKAQLIAEKKLKKEKELPPITADEIPFEIPEHWAWCKIGDITTSIVPNRDKPLTFSGDITWVTQSNFSEKSFKLNYDLNTLGFTKEEIVKYNCRVMPKGSIIMSCVGRFDLVCLIEREIVANQQLHCFVPNGEIVPMYLVYAVKLFSKYVEKDAIHTTIKYINKTKCESIPIPLPPLHEQEQIVAKLEELMAFCDGLEQSIKESQGYNEKLLQQVLREALQPSVGV